MRAALTLFVLSLAIGAGNSFLLKLIFGLHGTINDANFNKPVLSGLLLMLGMSLGLPTHAFVSWRASQSEQPGDRVARTSPRDLPRSTHRVIVFISLLDLLAVVLTNYGLGPLAVSIHTMGRSCVALFAALLRGIMLGKWPGRPGAYGMACIALAIAMAAVAGLAAGDGGGATGAPPGTAVGCASGACGFVFVLLGGFVRAVQYVSEEKLFDKTGIPPLLLVGCCGAWGCLWYCIILPAAQHAGVEDSADTWDQICGSATLRVLLCCYTFSLFAFNVCLMEVNAQLGATWKALVAVFRPGAVWVIQCLAYYVFTRNTAGSAAGKLWWVQLAGIILLFIGAALNNASLRPLLLRRLPCACADEQPTLESAKDHLLQPTDRR
jgi:hypothetical protein